MSRLILFMALSLRLCSVVCMACESDGDCGECDYCDASSGVCERLAGCCVSDGACPRGTSCDLATHTCEVIVPDDCDGTDQCCLIEGVGYNSGDLNPDDDCLACDPEISETDWSNQCRHLVLITHGWRSDVLDAAGLAFPVPMAFDILNNNHIPPEDVNDILVWSEHNIGTPDTRYRGDRSTTWDVVAFDWSDGARTLGPKGAGKNGARIGRNLGAIMKLDHYQFVHFIAHSAGSWLIDAATDTLKGHTPEIEIHQTYLDAYAPGSTSRKFGSTANWAEQYVHKTAFLDAFFNPLRLLYTNTNATLKWAINIDVTDIYESAGGSRVSDQHAFPWRWYRKTILDPNGAPDYGWGFQRSKEYQKKSQEGIFAGLPNDLRGTRIKIVGEEVIPQSDPIFLSNPVVIDPASLTVSETGEVTDSDANGFTLTTGSPVWASIPLVVDGEINFVQFDFEFLSDASGVLAVTWDGEVIFEADERPELTGVEDSGLVWLGGTFGAGAYELRYTLDSTDSDVSSVRISNIQVGFAAGPSDPSIPATSEWGMASVVLLLLAGLTIKFGAMRFSRKAA